jgi:hypothetical protein
MAIICPYLINTEWHSRNHMVYKADGILLRVFIVYF